jgi:anti-sigma factor RsiW
MNDLECPMLLLVQADFDGELDAGRAVDLIRHRADCAACQAAYAELTMVHDRLTDPALREKAPDKLRAFLARQSASASVAALPVNRPHSPPWRAVGSGVAGFALAAGLALALFQPSGPDPIALALDDHVRSLQAGHLQDVVSTDRHTVKPWFEGKLGFAPPVKDLAAQQFPLTGGRLDVMGGQTVAAMVYQRGTHPINLLVKPAAQGARDSEPATATRQGFTILHWVQDGMEMWAISDVEQAQLQEFARLWRAQS